MVRKLRAEKAGLESDFKSLQTNEKDKMASTTKHWEQTCEDLTRELTDAHGAIADREQTVRELEQALENMQGSL